ncbi:MAG TPA: amidase [Fimbriimonas sp.]|nr:amidase [Fimbriimonas sp.]
MKRRDFLKAGVLGGVALMAGTSEAQSGQDLPPEFELDEKTIGDLQDAMRSGQESSASITEKYLGRIESVDHPLVNSVIELNPDAESIAVAMDEERRAGKTRGPLHGIPVLIKDNIDTADKMRTTAGSMALAESIALKDSFVAAQLRKAGAVILGKTNLSEWANYRSTHSTSGWSGRGGQTHNPYALDRNPCGSSSGSGAAASANFCAVAVGTETDGSIVCPSNNNCLVGIKPTVGLIGRTGIIPISHSQDTSGPMARSVRDAAILLTALAGRDKQDAAATGKYGIDYTHFLDRHGLKGARIGVARKFFGFSDAVDKVMADAIHAMKKLGAVIVDPADLPTYGKFDDSEGLVLSYEFKADLEKYLSHLRPGQPKTLKELIDFNHNHKDVEMPFFGQELFFQSEARGPLTEAKYKKALAKNHRLARTEGIDAVMDKHHLDALIAPTGGPGWTTDLINGDHFTGGSSSPAAVAGYPDITVPAGFVSGMPVGISFFGRAWSEGLLIKLAYAFEQETKVRKKPRFLPTADFGDQRSKAYKSS